MDFLDNNYLLEYKGKTLTEKLKESIIDNILEVKEERLGYTPRFTETALVVCYDAREKYPEIKGLGSSAMIKEDDKLVEDLTVNNLMIWLSGWFGPVTPTRTRTLTEKGGTSSTITMSVYNNTSTPSVSLGTELQIGSGAPAFRADFKLVTPFPSGTQATAFNTNTGGWNSPAGRVTVNGSVVTSVVAGTVGEVGLFAVWRDNLAVVERYMLSHDIIIPGISFDPGESIQVTCTWVF